MDKYDAMAMAALSNRPELWEDDSIYPESRVLTETGRVERDRLAEHYRAQEKAHAR